MNRLLLVFVCICCFFSQAFANDEQTTRYKTVYEMDQLDHIGSSLLLESLVQTNQIEQTKEEQSQVIFQKGSGKIKVRYHRQIFPTKTVFPSITVPFTTDVIQTFQQKQRPVKGRRLELIWQINSPIQHPQINQLRSNKLLTGGAFIYDRNEF